jgi:EPS-associated MarR family transcriptional regulator
MNLKEKAHFSILRLIEERPEISQRELAGELGVSLGKTHYLLKALLDKGLVKMGNFRRHDNKLAYVYKLTPSGIAAKLNLTRDFLQHKEAEYLALHREIAELRAELAATVGVERT